MNSTDSALILVVAAWVSYVIAISSSRIFSSAKHLPDRPNHRSSHQRVTPRAGGLGVIAAWIVGVVIMTAFSGDKTMAAVGARFCVLGLAALALGYSDDRWSLAFYWKLFGQIAVAFGFVAIFGPLSHAPLPFVGLMALGPFGAAVTVFWIVAFMNAFNFMDGANGLAAGSAGVGLSVFAFIAAASGAPFSAGASILLAISLFGFLPINLDRGKLFMGDNGSQSISFIIAALGVLAVNESGRAVSALALPVIFAPFIFDVAWTLARRAASGQPITAAHREHLYQLLIRLGASHAKVATLYAALIAFSAAAAILMLAIAPSAQWLIPAMLFAFFTAGAVRVQIAAQRHGLFADDAAPDQQDAADEPAAAQGALFQDR